MTKLAPEWVRTSDPVIRSPARYRWTTAPALRNAQETGMFDPGSACLARITQSGVPKDVLWPVNMVTHGHDSQRVL